MLKVSYRLVLELEIDTFLKENLRVQVMMQHFVTMQWYYEQLFYILYFSFKIVKSLQLCDVEKLLKYIISCAV